MNLNNNVIYRISFKNCGASYIGQTKRQLSTKSQRTQKKYISKHIQTFLLSSIIY